LNVFLVDSGRMHSSIVLGRYFSTQRKSLRIIKNLNVGQKLRWGVPPHHLGVFPVVKNYKVAMNIHQFISVAHVWSVRCLGKIPRVVFINQFHIKLNEIITRSSSLSCGGAMCIRFDGKITMSPSLQGKEEHW